MSHNRGHIIISFALPHEHEDEERTHKLRREPAIAITLEASCTEDDCAEMARLAFRRLMERGD